MQRRNTGQKVSDERIRQVVLCFPAPGIDRYPEPAPGKFIKMTMPGIVDQKTVMLTDKASHLAQYANHPVKGSLPVSQQMYIFFFEPVLRQQ